MSKNLNAKLSISVRKDIARKVLDHRFGDTAKQLKAKRNALALDLYNLIYPEATRKLMSQLPSGFLPVSANVSVVINGYAHNYALADYLPGNVNAHYGSGHRFLEKTSIGAKLEARCNALDAEDRDYKTDFSKALQEVEAALAGFNTYKQLLESWPEVKPFVEIPEAANRQLPVSKVADLNARLNLPVKTAKEKRTASAKKAA
ncbi:Nmad5 family putative nucleotide modification protein [Dyella telluris]|uniref:Nucleotide modification associated domain-containing protein n=1 Tax=Dyella telluris TaxID=2763498 RepID=A0A7G8Q4L2_9GAMM|nr:Nmad5 family putative nucleotide modification protein [Dyella telluris]QNK01720.1 hypothetical protein H8F01_00625 [Dyella telluris]